MLLQEQYEPSEKQEMHVYIELVRDILLGHVEKYASDNNRTEVEVLTQIREQMDSTSSEYWSEQPSIEYENPLCRLGYLYRHVTANATLFEHVLDIADEVSSEIRAAAGDVLNVCALGGGPGTELLGPCQVYAEATSSTDAKKIKFRGARQCTPMGRDMDASCRCS